jgi:hypothetical protein
MKTTRLPLLCALLLSPALALANTVSIQWTGQIDGYGSVGSGLPPAPLSDPNISGVINLNLNLLLTPDAGNPFGVISFTGSDFLQSSIQWAGGLFQPTPPGATGSDSLYVDWLQGLCNITDQSVYVDSQGVAHEAVLSLNLVGPVQFTPGQGASFGNDVVGSGSFGDTSADGGFLGQFEVDRATTSRVSVPGPDMASLAASMLLAVSVLLLRTQRKRPVVT